LILEDIIWLSCGPWLADGKMLAMHHLFICNKARKSIRVFLSVIFRWKQG